VLNPKAYVQRRAARLRDPLGRNWILGAIVVASIATVVVGGAIANAQDAPHSSDSAEHIAAAAPTQPTHISTTKHSAVEPSQPAEVGLSTAVIATTSATALLATLPVKAALSSAGYRRTTDFGAAWLDEDRNGCDTRNDILSRDLTSLTKSGACTVLTGILVSPYTGATIDFVRGEKTSALVQIDHLVALGDAWETGAQALSQAQRESLANDPLELMAVDGRSNDEKGDKDASEWLPPNAAFDCTYVARQISVKVTYSLWVTPAEHAAMAAVLLKCGNITGTASQFAVVTNATPTIPSPVTSATAPIAAPAPAVVAPAPAVAPPVVVAPAAPAPVAPPAVTTPVVHPGAYCAAADAGEHGVTSDGTSMVCETSPTDSRLRWRAG
jgi:Protein of unknown function (DUF1524)